jgi:hypothetical protein
LFASTQQVDVHPNTNPSAPSATTFMHKCNAGMPLVDRNSLLGIARHISLTAAITSSMYE